MKAVWSFLKREPVTVWGSLISALIGIPALAGVPAWVITVIVSVLTALGVPVVRSSVTPVPTPAPEVTP